MTYMNILIIGGAGYIGSHTTELFAQRHHNVTVLDDLSSGNPNFVLNAKLIQGDFGNLELLEQLFRQYNFDLVMHFASYIEVGESVLNPAKYYLNNVAKTIQLLHTMLKHNCLNFIFSSTAAVYGTPNSIPIREDHVLNPINPYGRSKLMVEQILDDFQNAYGLRSISLRYFNAAGADLTARMGENHQPETHLIPLMLQSISQNSRLTVNGNDYPTADGTCIRDYVHVLDIAAGHLLAAETLFNKKTSSSIYNLGTGSGFSILQIIEAAERITQKTVDIHYGLRRSGDPAILVADNAKAKKELGWDLNYSDLDTIIASAWKWHSKYAASFC